EELSAFEKSVSANDLKSLEEVLAAIVNNPNLPGRVPSFYDPAAPSYLYRSGNFLLHFRVLTTGAVEFLNLFWPKV
ncbi:MAG: hypothetical protein ACREP5_03645, partial [Candidatus Binatia bacterium]